MAKEQDGFLSELMSFILIETTGDGERQLEFIDTELACTAGGFTGERC